MFNSNINSYQYFNRSTLNIFQKWWLDIDKVIFFFILSMVIFGMIMINLSSPSVAERIGVDRFFFIKKQTAFSIAAIFILITISFFDLKKITNIIFIATFLCLISLCYVLLFGFEVKGSKRWISLLGFSLQPSEFIKTFFVVINAYILCKVNSGKGYLLNYIASFFLLSLILFLLVMQPDFGMTIIIGLLWSLQLFLYGLPMVLVFIIGFFALGGGALAYIKFPHVRDRINRFLDFDAKNYQSEMSLDAYSSGSYFGTGPGAGVVKNYIPDAHTDFIFAVIAEEFGIISCIIILLFTLYIFGRILKRAAKEDNMFNYLILCGLLIEFILQTVINIGVTLRLLPTKGMTLPFISYGGSSTLSMAICFGLILILTKKRYHDKIDYGNMKLLYQKSN